jgi:hypothetical protein
MCSVVLKISFVRPSHGRRGKMRKTLSGAFAPPLPGGEARGMGRKPNVIKALDRQKKSSVSNDTLPFFLKNMTNFKKRG